MLDISGCALSFINTCKYMDEDMQHIHSHSDVCMYTLPPIHMHRDREMEVLKAEPVSSFLLC